MLDLLILFLSSVFIIVSLQHLGTISLINIILYLGLVVNAFIIALSFHILVLSIGVLTTEVDNTIMLYRDLTLMGRVPVDIYLEPIRGILTFIIPVGIMMTFPAKALMGFLSIEAVLLSFLMAAFFLLSSIKLWRLALRNYSSASS